MIQYRFIIFILGNFLAILSVAMMIPAAMDLYYNDPNWICFGQGAALTGFVGTLLILAFRPESAPSLEVRETFLLTVSSWATISSFAALPFLLSGTVVSFTDALFEAISGLTTTGATVLLHVQDAPPGILLWRALLQWLGGIGIVVMAVAILPVLKIGGMQLFRSEFSDRSEKYLPRVSQISTAILSTYLLISMFCAMAYWFAGMGMFDALCYMMTTVSTAGFATSDQSLGGFDNPWIEGVAMVFMLAGSMTLLLFTRFLQGDMKVLWKDSQIRAYLCVILLAASCVTVWLIKSGQYEGWQALRHGAFAVVSIASTTGFTTADFQGWGSFPLIFLLLLMFVGGCTGSTAGGIKIFRVQILFKAAKTQMKQLRRPHGVFEPLYNMKRLRETEFMSVLAFFALYILCYAALALSLSFCGIDMLSSLSGSATILGNVGPGLGSYISATGHYGTLPETAKWIAMVGMLVGRLELVAVLILLTPSFWRT